MCRLACAAHLRLTLTHADVSAAFTHAPLPANEQCVLIDPPGVSSSPGKVLVLRKALYGLRQAPLRWWELIHSQLLSFGLIQSSLDPCLYVLPSTSPDSPDLWVCLYVDDLLVVSSSQALANSLITFLSNSVNIKNLGRPDAFLGCKLAYTDNGILLSQQHLVNEVITLMKLQDCNPGLTPERKVPLENPDLTPFADKTHFRSVLGKLVYLSCHTRPDIYHATLAASHGSTAPTQHDYAKLKYIARYLKGTPDLGLLFEYGPAPAPTPSATSSLSSSSSPSSLTAPTSMTSSTLTASSSSASTSTRSAVSSAPSTQSHSTSSSTTTLITTASSSSAQPIPVFCYSDATWASDKDRHSISGGIAIVSYAPVLWYSVRQSSIATSSCESELVAVSVLLQDMVWLNDLLALLTRNNSIATDIYMDNQAACNAAVYPQQHSRLKHVHLRQKWVYDTLRHRPHFIVQHVPSEQNLADLYTKAPTVPFFQFAQSHIVNPG